MNLNHVDEKRIKNFTSIAAFDLDHTLLNVSGSFLFGKYLYSQKIFSFTCMCRLVSYYCRHKALGMSLQDIHLKSFQVLFSQKSLALFEHHADLFVQSLPDKIMYGPAYERLKQLQNEGVYTVILSNSPGFLVGSFARKLGVNEWAGSSYGVDKDGTLCTISRLMEGKDKAEYCLSLAERLGISRSRLQAYSDSYLDLPFLEAAGQAVAVNPDKKLLRISQKRNWEIL